MTDERKAIVAYLREVAEMYAYGPGGEGSEPRGPVADTLEACAQDIEDMHVDTMPTTPASLHAAFDCADNKDCDASCPTCKGVFT